MDPTKTLSANFRLRPVCRPVNPGQVDLSESLSFLEEVQRLVDDQLTEMERNHLLDIADHLGALRKICDLDPDEGHLILRRSPEDIAEYLALSGMQFIACGDEPSLQPVIIRPLPGTILLDPPERLRWSAPEVSPYWVSLQTVGPPKFWDFEPLRLPELEWPGTEIELQRGSDCDWSILFARQAVYDLPADRVWICSTFRLAADDDRRRWEEVAATICRRFRGPKQSLALALLAVTHSLFDLALDLMPAAVDLTSSAILRGLFYGLAARYEAGIHRGRSIGATLHANECLKWSICQLLGKTDVLAAGQCDTCRRCGLIPSGSSGG